MSSSLIKEFDHLRIPLEEIKSATDNFAIKHNIGEGGFGKVYHGQILQHGQRVAIKRFDRGLSVPGGKEFWTEVLALARLKHENLVSVVGFCDEDGEKIIIYEYAAHGSLDRHLSDPIALTWMQRLHICVGVARALSFIHYDTGRNYGVTHLNIKSSVILLDENWEPKVSGFGLDINNLATRRHPLILDRACGTFGYIDPVYLETGTVTHKSDVYSFGVVLFEVLCGRLALITEFDDERRFLAVTATRHYETGKLDEIIDPFLRNQMHPESFKIFSDTAYHYLKKQRAQRPDMEKVAKRLEKAWELQWKHENPEHSKTPVDVTWSNHMKERNFGHLKIQLADIKMATQDFAEKYCIGWGGYGMVYKAELDHFDNNSSPEKVGENQGEFPKRRSTVAIKRIFSRSDGQGDQGFLAEIELLTSCKHPNVVSLLGFCDEGPERILVYEHATNRSLDDYLGNNDNMTIFSWVQRIKMCLDIANGLRYLHTTTEDKEMIIHRDIKSANILLGKNWEAKIADFGLSRIQLESMRNTKIAGTEVYLDPEYSKTGNLKAESDIYSFGVVLFEVLCRRLAYDERFYVNNDNGLPSTVRRFYKEGILKEIIDPRLNEETHLNSFALKGGPNQDSLDVFLKIAYQCLAETQAERPKVEVIIKELEKALYFQENHKDKLQIPLEDIKSATQNFSDNNIIGKKKDFQNVYKGEVIHANGRHIIAAKRLVREKFQTESNFLRELEVLLEYKNDNMIGLVGYCDEMGEKIIVYEYATCSSLDRHLSCIDFTWMERLKVCIDVSGLEFLHGGVVTQDVVIHRDIKSANILLTEDWKAKISGFGLSMISPINQEKDFITDDACGTLGYVDPQYFRSGSGFLSRESDIFSLGVVLFEILCGTTASEYHNTLHVLAKRLFRKRKLEQMVFKGISDQIVPESLTAYSFT